MIHIQITPGLGLPAYRQLMDQVKYHVASGALRMGEPLPSIRELARRLGLNPSTVVKAYTELAHEGVIELRQGKGAFISPGTPRLSVEEVRGALGRSLQRLAVEASQMGVGVDALVEMLREEMAKLEPPRGAEHKGDGTRRAQP